MAGSVSGERTHEETFCSGGTEILVAAPPKAMCDVPERYGERVSNSQKLFGAMKNITFDISHALHSCPFGAKKTPIDG